MQVPLYDMAGEVKDHIEIDDKLFGLAFNEAVVHQALVRHEANRRQGTASTKVRSEVAGSTRKLFRQKHTGNARAGSAKSPLRRGGGITFGPKPRSYNQSMPRSMRRLAIRCALSSKVESNDFVVIEGLSFESPRTGRMAELLIKLGLTGRAVIALESVDENVIKSARNIPWVTTVQARQLNVADIINCQKLLITEQAVRQIENLWGEAGNGGQK